MAHRTPTSANDQTAPMPVWKAPEPGSYQRTGAGPNCGHRHDDGRDDEFHYDSHLPHYHDPDSGVVVFFDPAAPAPTGAATAADPAPAGTPGDQAAATAGPVSGAVGPGRPQRARGADGRFLGHSRPAVPATLPVSVALEHALIDADAATFLATQHHKLAMARVLLDAIRFGVEADRLETALAVKAGMLVRLGSDGGGP